MRRTVLTLALVLGLVGCSSGDSGGATDTTTATSVAVAGDLPAEVRAFVDEVAEPGTIAFRATYRVLRKLGADEHTVEVVSEPPSWQIRFGDLLVVDGPTPATCRASKQQCVGEVRESVLAPTGVFSRFFSTAPAQALATDARREGAGEAVASTTTVAGIELRCLAVPIDGSAPSSYCLTPDGVFGAVDTPAVRYELVAYRAGPTGESAGVPFPLTTDGGFLTS